MQWGIFFCKIKMMQVWGWLKNSQFYYCDQNIFVAVMKWALNGGGDGVLMWVSPIKMCPPCVYQPLPSRLSMHFNYKKWKKWSGGRLKSSDECANDKQLWCAAYIVVEVVGARSRNALNFYQPLYLRFLKIGSGTHFPLLIELTNKCNRKYENISNEWCTAHRSERWKKYL